MIHGVEVADPYRWLEDGDSEQTKAWASYQNARTRATLDVVPCRARLHARLTELFRAGTSSAPVIEGGRLFSVDRWGHHDRAVLCVRPLDGTGAQEPNVILDPMHVVFDETAAIDWFHPSRDGSLVAYGVSSSGDERSTLRILDITTGEHLDDEIPHTRAASVGWLPDASGFAYTRYAGGGDYDRHVFWHRLGTPWTDDTVLFDDLPDETAWPDVSVSRDGRYALVHVELGWSRNDVHLIELATNERRTLIEGVEVTTWLTVDDRRDRLVGHTTLDAARGRVIAVPLGAASLAPDHWQTLVPESDAVIEGTVVARDVLLVASTRRAVSSLTQHRMDGSFVGAVELPELGSFAGVAASRDDDIAVFSFTGFARPPALFRWTPDDGVRQWSDLPGRPDPNGFSVEQRTYTSTDGTEVAIFLVNGPDGGSAAGRARPTILTAYGGFADRDDTGVQPDHRLVRRERRLLRGRLHPRWQRRRRAMASGRDARAQAAGVR